MKIAPSIRPPDSTWYSIHCTRDTSPIGNRNVTTATVRMYAAGILMVMTLRHSRYRPPAISASADVSPITPPVWPRNISISVASGRTPFLSEASGVAVEIASVRLTVPNSGRFACGAVQVVIRPL